MKVDEEDEQGVNYNIYETDRNSRKGLSQEIAAEIIEMIKAPSSININFKS
jgi:hypothetical protein